MKKSGFYDHEICFNGSNTKNTPQNLQLNFTKVKRTSYQSSLLLMHENENFKSEFLEMVHKILNDLSNKKEKMICSMSFATFNMTTFLIKDLKKKKWFAQCPLQRLIWLTFW